MKIRRVSYWILHLPMAQILLGIVICYGIMAIGQAGVSQLLRLTVLDKDTKNLINGVVAATLVEAVMYCGSDTMKSGRFQKYRGRK